MKICLEFPLEKRPFKKINVEIIFSDILKNLIKDLSSIRGLELDF